MSNLTSCWSSLDSVKNFACSANGSGVSLSPSLLKPGHYGGGGGGCC